MTRSTPKHVRLALVPILAFLLGGDPLPLFGDEREPAAVRAELGTYIDEVFESEPAWGGALIARDGKILFERSYGWSDYDQAKRNRRKTVFRIQSLSKTFTAMSVLMLVERGRLSLDDPVVDYVPELREAEGVTIRHLLQMQSGIPDLLSAGLLAEMDRFHTPEELVQFFIDLPLLFEPGTRFDYSNSNYILLGLIIERLSGKPYGRFLKRNIFRPLEMKRSVFDPDDLSFRARLATGYDDVVADPPTVAEHFPPSMAYAAGGIVSTARDLLKWDQALYGERLLSREMRDEAFTRGVSFYGLGWIVDRVKIHGKRHKIVSHPGGGPGFRSALVRLVDARVTLILLYNTTGVEDLADEEVVRRMARLARDVGSIVLEERE